MSDPSEARSHGARILALHATLLSAACGAVLGARSAWSEIELQGYDHFGLWRTAWTMLASASARAMVLGGLVALALSTVAVLAWFEPALRDGGRIERCLRTLFAGAFDLGALFGAAIASLACVAVLVASRGAIAQSDVFFALALVALGVWRAGASNELGGASVWSRAASIFYAPAALAIFVRRAQLVSRSGAPWEAGSVALTLALALATLVYAWPMLYGLRLVPSRRAWHVGLLLVVELGIFVPFYFHFAPAPHSSVAEARAAPNVLIIGIDTLRFDHVSYLGPTANGRDTTPNLRKLAERGTVFTQAISQAPWTMSAFASIFTGKYPFEHGAISKKGELRKSEVVLAELLREAGFDTGSVVSHYFVNDSQGFGQGYEYFNRDNVKDEMAITSEGVTRAALAWLHRERQQPFFGFFHYFDPHYEYRDHPESTWADGYDGWLKRELQIQNVRHKRHWLGAAEKTWLTDLYDEEIFHTDREIGRVLDDLAQRGLDRNTWIFVVADHGEEFFEHGWIGHSITLYDELIHVPLIVVPPVGTAHEKVVGDQVETRAVFASVLDVAGVHWDAAALYPSLMNALRGVRKDSSQPEARAFSCVWTPDANPETGLQAQIFSLRTERWKVIWDQARQLKQLFDLRADPRELTDVAASQPEEFARLFALLESWSETQKKQLPRIPYRKITGAEAQRLHGLGYL